MSHVISLSLRLVSKLAKYLQTYILYTDLCRTTVIYMLALTPRVTHKILFERVQFAMNLQLLGASPDLHQGLCPCTPLGDFRAPAPPLEDFRPPDFLQN